MLGKFLVLEYLMLLDRMFSCFSFLYFFSLCYIFFVIKLLKQSLWCDDAWQVFSSGIPDDSGFYVSLLFLTVLCFYFVYLLPHTLFYDIVSLVLYPWFYILGFLF